MGSPYKIKPTQKQTNLKRNFTFILIALMIILIIRFFITNEENLSNMSLGEPSGVSYLTVTPVEEPSPSSSSSETEEPVGGSSGGETEPTPQAPTEVEGSVVEESASTTGDIVESFQYVVPAINEAHTEKVNNSVTKFFIMLGIFCLITLIASFVFMKKNTPAILVVLVLVIIMAVIISIVRTIGTSEPNAIIKSDEVKNAVGYTDYQNNEHAEEFIKVNSPISDSEKLRITLLNTKNHRLYDFDVTSAFRDNNQSELVVTYTNIGYTTSDQALGYYFGDDTTAEDYAELIKEADAKILQNLETPLEEPLETTGTPSQ